MAKRAVEGTKKKAAKRESVNWHRQTIRSPWCEGPLQGI